MTPELDQLQAADDELTHMIRAGVREAIMGSLPALLPALLAVVMLIRQRAQIRRHAAILIMEAVPDADPGTPEADAAEAEAIVRIQLALPDWARLEQDPSGRWLVLDSTTAADSDSLAGAEIVAVLQAPSWALRMGDEELATWARRLGQGRHAR